jgi:uncharacterized protein
MNLQDIIKKFSPNTKVFFDAFETMADELDAMGKMLYKFVHQSDANERATIVLQIEEANHRLEAKSHDVFLELSANFITPFDKEDVHALTSSMEAVGDYIRKSAKKINFYKVDPSDKGIVALAETIELSTVVLKKGIIELRRMKNIGYITNAIVEINKLENQADDIYDQSIKDIFLTEKDAKEIIKKCEIYQVMEIVTDKCEDASNVIESIVVKHS